MEEIKEGKVDGKRVQAERFASERTTGRLDEKGRRPARKMERWRVWLPYGRTLKYPC